MDAGIDILKLGLDGAQKRQKTIANNIANVETPEYKRKDVDFLSVLKKEADAKSSDSSTINPDKIQNLSLSRTNNLHMENAIKKNKDNFSVETDMDTKYRNDGNNVDVDYEMAELSKTNLYYNTLAQRISGKFRNLNEVISKGGS
ncbi:MAG: flagellar basal body rod protein FlgB [Bacillota bacterium]